MCVCVGGGGGGASHIDLFASTPLSPEGRGNVLVLRFVITVGDCY